MGAGARLPWDPWRGWVRAGGNQEMLTLTHVSDYIRYNLTRNLPPLLPTQGRLVVGHLNVLTPGRVFKLSVGMTSHAEVLEIEGLFTQGSRPGRTFGESVGGMFEMDSSDWLNGIRYHIFDTRPDTEF